MLCSVVTSVHCHRVAYPIFSSHRSFQYKLRPPMKWLYFMHPDTRQLPSVHGRCFDSFDQLIDRNGPWSASVRTHHDLLFQILADGNTRSKDQVAKQFGYDGPKQKGFVNLFVDVRSMNIVKHAGKLSVHLAAKCFIDDGKISPPWWRKTNSREPY